MFHKAFFHTKVCITSIMKVNIHWQASQIVSSQATQQVHHRVTHLICDEPGAPYMLHTYFRLH